MHAGQHRKCSSFAGSRGIADETNPRAAAAAAETSSLTQSEEQPLRNSDLKDFLPSVSFRAKTPPLPNQSSMAAVLISVIVYIARDYNNPIVISSK